MQTHKCAQNHQKRLWALYKRKSKIKASVSKKWNELQCANLRWPSWVSQNSANMVQGFSATFSCLPFSKRNKQTIAIFRSQLHIEYIISFNLWNRVRIWMFPSYLFRRWTLFKEIDLWKLYFLTIYFFAGESAGTKYSDPKVCKSFLLACCPHDILAATVSFKHHLP